MSDMEYKRLSDCATWGKDRTRDINYESYISTENMIKDKGGVTIASSLPDSKTASAYSPNDILLSNIRPYFRKIWYADKNGSCSNDVLVVRADEDIDSKFLYYVLSDNNFFNYDTVTSKGTKMPRGTQTAIMKYLVPDINVGKQRKIADILSAYDNLIENNNKRIKLLEQMAENLYKEWFVRFRFPGYEDMGFENGIPMGWKIKRIKDFGQVITGKTPSTEISSNYGDKYLFIKTPDMHDNMYVIDSSEKLSEHGNDVQKLKKLPRWSIMVSCIGTGGVVSINSKEAHTNQQINSIVLHDENNIEWLFFVCKSLKTTIEMFGATGSTMTNLSKGKFENLKILEPNLELIDKYHMYTYDIFKEVEKLMYSNENLIKQRDLLLPRLMSGKLEV